MQSTPVGIAVAFAVGQAYLIAKLILRLSFFGGQMAIYDGARQTVAAGPEQMA